MSALRDLLSTYRKASQTEREKGTYFEELICTYLRNEATYKDLYSQVWPYADWAREQGIDARDTGIDLVAQTQGTNEFHAIQCKFYAEDYRIQKSDIDSFFTASGKKIFSHRIIVTTTSVWSEHAEEALRDQHPPVTKIDLIDLENSQIDWSKYQPKQKPILKDKKKLRDHQRVALERVLEGLKNADRGKLIMACGTGKTFNSLKIAEKLTGKGKRVLFLVPSLSLLSQTLTEWTQESEIPLHSFAVCSDSEVGRKRKKDDDIVETFAHELRYPATTEPSKLAKEIQKRHDSHHMSVVFSTYHSIEVISKAQHKYELPDFDLIICDEAHRTTGATFDTDDESNFVKVHDAKFIRSKKRIYMTATPRIYGDAAKAVAEKDNIAICSMDDEALYGKELYVLTFSESVRRDLLVDYKVVVLAVDEAHVSSRLQTLLADENNQIKVDDAGKIVGCWKALSKQGMQESSGLDDNPMRKAVAFCQVIEYQKDAKKHKVSSKNIAQMFQAVVEAYQEQEIEKHPNPLKCEASHVDGSMNAMEKEAKLTWLKEETPENICRILSNVRCLSEGVDVPALDAVIFLTPRNSQVDVVQSVGRVMRKAEGKKRGYVILPVVIPVGVEPHEALNDNQTYRVVWQVLQALRSHDDRFDAMINKLDLIGHDKSKMEIIAVTEKIASKSKEKKSKYEGSNVLTAAENTAEYGTNQNKTPQQIKLEFKIGEIERAIYAKVVQKCGNRHHWEDWATDIAKIAKTHITRIQTIVNDEKNKKEVKAFTVFANELRDDLNDSITNEEVIEMLAQHLITKPVFDALFSDYSFAKSNPISQAMQGVLNILQEHHLDKEADTLNKFYESVKMRATGIDNAQGKQKIIVELYDKFFRNAFPKMTERLGIVYTPVEVVDFILHSVNDILKNEFGQTLGSDGIHILDPFSGTGTFISRLLQSGLIKKEELEKKYKGRIHANEIVLLAYYIAAINIEATYHSIVGGEYQPFEGICLTDTFQLYEKEDLISALLVDNSNRRQKQKKLDIRVIIGNPPYSSGQESANDNNQNISYKNLDDRIRATYAEYSESTNKNALYNSYIRAIRWASDRIGNIGVIGFVSGSGFIEKPVMSGLRKCLVDEFSNIFVLNLRGDIRKNMLSRGKAKEGENIFGSGSMAGIAITIFVKNPQSHSTEKIKYYDIGDDLKSHDKIEKIVALKSIEGLTNSNAWKQIAPDKHNDWINQRDDSFEEFIPLGDKKDKTSIAIFANYSRGIATSRDAWCYNYSKTLLEKYMREMVSFYNSEVNRYKNACGSLHKNEWPEVDGFINTDETKISWSRGLKNDLGRQVAHNFESKSVVPGLYRPFTKQWSFFNKYFNDMIYQMPKIFPDSTVENRVICVSGVGARSGFSSIIADTLPDLEIVEKSQCFPLYLYEKIEAPDQSDPKGTGQTDMFAAKSDKKTKGNSLYIRKDGISDEGLKHFYDTYPKEEIAKEDLFYYIYGLLHSPDYREKYADNLTKELPRIPCVKSVADFWAFSKAGRELAELHINYESAPCYAVTIQCNKKNLTAADFYVTKMKFATKGDKSTVVYNPNITMTGIPVEAYDYVVNGKPALEWVMERQAVTTHKESGIVNDANLWATETMKNPRYPLELFQRVITVSLVTNRIVKGLPKLDILETPSLQQKKP